MDTIQAKWNTMFHSKLVRLLVVVVISIMLVTALTGAAISKYAVIITDDMTQEIVFTSEENPETILAVEEYALGVHDKYEFSGFSENKATIDILRAREVVVNADNTTKTTYVTEGNVGEALSAINITVDSDDLVNFSVHETVSDDMNITINRVVNQTVVKTEEIPFETDLFKTNTLKNGVTKTLKEGKVGTTTYTVAQKLIDGAVVEEEILSTEVVEPVKARMLLGDSKAAASQLIPAEPIELDENGNPVNYTAKYTGKATAYSALGKRTSLKPGCVAMNLSQFPKGTQLYIKTPNGNYTYGYSVVRDTGTALVQGKVLVDLFFASYAESVAFGAKNVEVYVLN